MKRKLVVLRPVEAFFELHSRDTEGEKDKKWVKKAPGTSGFSQWKKFNEFVIYETVLEGV